MSASNSVIPTPKMLIGCKRGDAKKYCVEAEKSWEERLRGMKCGGRGGVCTLLDLGDDSGAEYSSAFLGYLHHHAVSFAP